jgi:hypothetical protein
MVDVRLDGGDTARLLAASVLDRLDQLRRSQVNHALVGHLAVREHVLAVCGPGDGVIAEQLGSVVGSHHGVPPEISRPATLGP